ncbi:MAG: hypothetical protein QXE85_00155 [Nitrososphaerota archaeon]
MAEKYVCRLCGDTIGEEFILEEALNHLIECHPRLLESLATWIAERIEEESK